MTHQEIFKQAAERAVANGWAVPPAHKNLLAHMKGGWAIAYRTIIYDHGFASALWGRGPDCALCGVSPHSQHYSNCIEGSNIWPFVWEWHLQQMVVADDPIEYLGKNLPK